MKKKETFDDVRKHQKIWNGKSFSFWDHQANILVADALLRASHNMDPRSLTGYLAQTKLIQLMEHVDQGAWREALALRENFLVTVIETMDEIMNPKE